LFYLGLLVGVTIGFLFFWWFDGRSRAAQPFFARLLQGEMASCRLSRRQTLYELEQQVKELSGRLEKLEGKEGKVGGREKDGGEAIFNKEKRPGEFQKAGPLLDRYREIYRLFQKGLSPAEIAEELKIGRGEVDLALSLSRKPSWVIEKKNN